jgi:hypothetical protein
LDIGVGWRYLPDMERVMLSELWLLKLEKANHAQKIFPENALRRVLAERWLLAVSAATKSGLKAWNVYQRSELSRWANNRFWRSTRLFTKCIYYGR